MDNRLAYLQEEYALSFEKAANDYPAIDDPKLQNEKSKI